VEKSHTNLSEVTRMVLVKIWTCQLNSTMLKSTYWFGGDADHQPNHDHLDVCDACQHDRDCETLDHYSAKVYNDLPSRDVATVLASL
jgi:hypothetical protein